MRRLTTFLILILSFGVYFTLTKPLLSQTRGRCGDGICDEFEKRNPDLCPDDCKEETQPVPSVSGGTHQTETSGSSPYLSEEKLFNGVATDFQINSHQSINFLKDLGINFVNLRAAFTWSGIEPQKGEFDWKRTDRIVSLAYRNGISLMPMIFPCRGIFKDTGGYSSYCVPYGHNIGIRDEDIEGYRNFVFQTVSRYKDKIKYWQLMEEAASQAKNDPEGYAKTLKITYEEIKRADPEAKVVCGQFPVHPVGSRADISSSKSYFEKVFNSLEGNYFDVFEVLYSIKYKEQYKEVGKVGKEIREFLDQNGYSNVPIFFSTTADTSNLSEREQAGQIIRLYTTALSTGLFSKIIWDELYGCWKVKGKSVERGLLWCKKREKKLGYYTYKKMVEVLEGSDWDNIQTIKESNGIYIYKFTRKGKPIWVAWNDNEKPKKITITLDKDIKGVKITEAVPRYNSGKEVRDYETAFREIKGVISEGYPLQLSFELGDIPVFVEEK